MLAAGGRTYDLSFVSRLGTYARRVPERLLAEIEAFRVREEDGVILLRGLPIRDRDLGPTPGHWREIVTDSPDYSDVLALLISSLLGDVFGWRSEQDGRLVQNVVPVQHDESTQINSGSREEIWWHTEDAHHPYPADYLILLGLRNLERAATTLCHVVDTDLSPAHLSKLKEAIFTFRPDLSHIDGESSPATYRVLSGETTSLHVRIDPFFMDVPADLDASEALNALRSWIDARLLDVVVEQGDCLIIDNLTTVHGRRSFRAAYGPTGRWLKRVNVARDVRRSVVARHGAAGRVLS
ncbi:TauD/TfdA family dioxygenase [Actinoallomurus acanthiterrae]